MTEHAAADATTESLPDPADVALLQQQVTDLREELAGHRRARRRRARTIASAVVAVVAVLATTLTILAGWTFRTFTETDKFVARIGPIIEEPAVQTAIGETAATQLIDGIGLEERLRRRLPDNLDLLAGPITEAAQNYLAKASTTAVASDQFRTAWDIALRDGHRATIAVLSGKDTAVIGNDAGVVVVNLAPVVNGMLAAASDFMSGVLGADLGTPSVTPENVDAAIKAIEERTGTDLPGDFGQVVIFQSKDLAAAQATYQAIRTAVWLAPIAALVLIGLALAIAPRRLRTALGIALGVGLLMLLIGLATQPLRDVVVTSVADTGLSGAVGSAFDTVLSSLLTGIVWAVVIGVVAGLGLLISGRSKVAVAGRAQVRVLPRTAARHRTPFLVGGAVGTLLILWALPGRSLGQLGFGLLLYGAYALAVLFAPEPLDAEAEADAIGDVSLVPTPVEPGLAAAGEADAATVRLPGPLDPGGILDFGSDQGSAAEPGPDAADIAPTPGRAEPESTP